MQKKLLANIPKNWLKVKNTVELPDRGIAITFVAKYKICVLTNRFL